MIKLIKWFLASIFSIFIGILICISVFFAFIQTDLGERTIEDLVTREAAKHHIVLSMDSIKGRLPFRWKIANIKIRTKDNVEISIEKFKGRVSFFALLRGEFFLESIKLFHVTILPPSSVPFPSFSARGKGKWKERISTVDLNLSAFVDDDPKTVLVVNVRGDPFRALNGFFDFSTPSTRIFSSHLDLPLHGEASLRAHFSGTLKKITFNEIKLLSPLFQFQGEMTAVHLREIESARASFQFLYPLLVEGHLEFKEEHLELTAQTEEFMYGEQEFSSSKLIVDAHKGKSLWEGTVDASVQSEQLPLHLTAKLSIDVGKEIALQDLYCLAPHTEAGGKLSFHFPKYSLDGALFVQAKDLSLFSRLWPESGLEGQGGGEITFSSSPVQTVGLRLLLDHFHFDKLRSRLLSIKLDAQTLFSTPQGIGAIEVEDFAFRNLRLDQGTLQFHSDRLKTPFEIRAKGFWQSPLDLSLAGSLSLFTETKELTLDRFDGRLIDRDFHLKIPFSLSKSADTFRLTEGLLEYTDGWFKSRCLISKEDVDIVVKSENFPLRLFTRPSGALSLGGGAGIDLEFFAKQDALQGHLNLLLEQVRVFQFGKSSPLMAKGSLSANINKDKLQLHAHLLSSGHQFFTTSASLPVHFSHETKRLVFERTKPFSAQVFLDGRVEEIFDFLNLGSQEIRGHVMGQVFLSNTLAKPQLKGGIRLVDGRYENFAVGTSLKDAELELIAENESLTLKSASAKGPHGGTITGKGALKVDLDEHFPFHFETEVNELRGVDFDMFSACLSGPIFFDGSFNELLIHGKVSVSSAEFKIPDTLPIDLPDYPVHMIHPPFHLITLSPQKSRYPVHYDFKLKAEDHVKVHGRGLDSEWKGKAHIKGMGLDFKGDGSLSLVRGEFNFTGKRFSLTQGEITFSENGALIDLHGNLQLADATITAVLSGSLTAPSLTFQSSPAMPTSSILSRLIFNKDISEITPFQAIQLANMIVTLSGDSGPNVLEKIRKSLGVDRFNIVSGGATGDVISLQIGKYLAQGVMITLSQSAHSSQVIVEVELKGGFIFQGETQEEEEGKFSLKWNHNY